MFYPATAVERAMRIQEVILRAISGEMFWFQAAEILGVSVATMRRWKAHYEHQGYDGSGAKDEREDHGEHKFAKGRKTAGRFRPAATLSVASPVFPLALARLDALRRLDAGGVGPGRASQRRRPLDLAPWIWP